jgi:hypothetical protein
MEVGLGPNEGCNAKEKMPVSLSKRYFFSLCVTSENKRDYFKRRATEGIQVLFNWMNKP